MRKFYVVCAAVLFVWGCEQVVEEKEMSQEFDAAFHSFPAQVNQTETGGEEVISQAQILTYQSDESKFSFKYSANFDLTQAPDSGDAQKILNLVYLDSATPALTPETLSYFLNQPRLEIYAFDLPDISAISDKVESLINGGTSAYVKFNKLTYLRAYAPALTSEAIYFITCGLTLYAIVVHNFPSQLFDEEKNEAVDAQMMQIVQTFSLN